MSDRNPRRSSLESRTALEAASLTQCAVGLHRLRARAVGRRRTCNFRAERSERPGRVRTRPSREPGIPDMRWRIRASGSRSIHSWKQEAAIWWARSASRAARERVPRSGPSRFQGTRSPSSACGSVSRARPEADGRDAIGIGLNSATPRASTRLLCRLPELQRPAVRVAGHCLSTHFITKLIIGPGVQDGVVL